MKAIQNLMSKKSFSNQLKNGAPTRFQRGVTAVELIIGLAVIGLVIAGVAVTAQSTFRDQKVNDEAQRVQMLQSRIRAYLSSSQDTTSATVKNLAASKYIPLDAIDAKGENITSKFGYPVAIIPGTLATGNDAVQIIYSNLKSEECINFAKAAGNAFNAVGVAAGSAAVVTTAFAAGAYNVKSQTKPFDNDTLVTSCKDGSNVAFVMSKS
jgi:type II secretory pathway pseudopilin PulG